MASNHRNSAKNATETRLEEIAPPMPREIRPLLSGFIGGALARALSTNDIVNQSLKYWRSAGRKELAHYLAASKDLKWHRIVGTPSAFLSAIVATSLFTTLSDNATNKAVRVGTAAVAVLATVFAALQVFLGYAELSEKHLAAAARFGKARRDLDLLMLQCRADPPLSHDDALESLAQITAELNSAEAETPSLSAREYQVGKDGFDNTHPITP